MYLSSKHFIFKNDNWQKYLEKADSSYSKNILIA